ncbi:hypothetical protein AALB64_00440 [Lachnospiraceae bacterium 45-P1]
MTGMNFQTRSSAGSVQSCKTAAPVFPGNLEIMSYSSTLFFYRQRVLKERTFFSYGQAHCRLVGITCFSGKNLV